MTSADVDLDHLAEGVRLLHCKVSLFPTLFQSVLFGKKLLCAAHTWKWGIVFHLHNTAVSHIRLSVTPWTVAHQAPLSMGFSQARILDGLPCPSPDAAVPS